MFSLTGNFLQSMTTLDCVNMQIKSEEELKLPHSVYLAYNDLFYQFASWQTQQPFNCCSNADEGILYACNKNQPALYLD